MYNFKTKEYNLNIPFSYGEDLIQQKGEERVRAASVCVCVYVCNSLYYTHLLQSEYLIPKCYVESDVIIWSVYRCLL